MQMQKTISDFKEAIYLSESISHALNGKRSGKGYRIPSICHGGEDRNLYIQDGNNGKLIATCFSHGCEYKRIMQVLEEMNLKPKTSFSPQQRKAFIHTKSKRQLREALQIELHIALQYLNDRAGDDAKASDSGYLKSHPEFQKMPGELFEREKLSYTRILKGIGALL